MQHHNPHNGAAFEGYFSRFDLPSGASLVLVVCSVHDSPSPKSNYVALRYIPGATSVRGISNMYQLDLWTKTFSLQKNTHGGFSLEACGAATEGSLVVDNSSNVETANSSSTVVKVEASSNQIEYTVHSKELGLSLHAVSTDRVPWHYLDHGYDISSTPEGLLAHLPLPLHWHVQSLASKAKFSLRLPGEAGQSDLDHEGVAVAHEEKNWAVGFPKAHIWALGRNFTGSEDDAAANGRDGARVESSVCLAGGKIVGTEAFLINYTSRSKGLSIDFRPPIALRMFGLSLCVSFVRDFAKRSFELTTTGLSYSLRVRASAPKESFFAFAAPWPEGFRENMMSESLNGQIEVTVWQRHWWLFGWREIHNDIFENCGVEFGGEYFPLAGTKQRVN